MFGGKGLKGAVDRETEEKFFEMAYTELENGVIRKGLMAKALSKCDGDVEKSNALYLKLRAQSIIDELRIAEEREARVATMLAASEQSRKLTKREAEKQAEIEKARAKQRKIDQEAIDNIDPKFSLFLLAIAFLVIAITAFNN